MVISQYPRSWSTMRLYKFMYWGTSKNTLVPRVVCVHASLQFKKAVCTSSFCRLEDFCLCIHPQFNSTKMVFVQIGDIYCNSFCSTACSPIFCKNCSKCTRSTRGCFALVASKIISQEFGLLAPNFYQSRT